MAVTLTPSRLRGPLVATTSVHERVVVADAHLLQQAGHQDGFRQFELYYVVGDERDLIGVRTNLRGERVRLYRLDVSLERARELLEVYARRVDDLVEHPAWYNALSHNCTTSIRLHAVELGIEQPWNWRVLVNGHGEELLYMRGNVNTTLPFDELRRRSDVTEAARAAADAEDFSARIREGLPARPSRH
jgi:hypothetical protein